MCDNSENDNQDEVEIPEAIWLKQCLEQLYQIGLKKYQQAEEMIENAFKDD